MIARWRLRRQFRVQFGDGGGGLGVQQVAQGGGGAVGPGQIAVEDVAVDAFENAVLQPPHTQVVQGKFLTRAQHQRVVQKVIQRARGELLQLADAQAQTRPGGIKPFGDRP